MPETPSLPLVRWADGPTLGVDVAVTTRHGGVSAAPFDTLNLGLHVGDDPEHVVTNRRRAAAAFGVTLEDLVFGRQVHGAGTTLVGPHERGRGTRADDDALPSADVLVTVTPGITLAIMVADCVPLALVDPEARVLAAVHAGWRGTAAGAVGAALRAMQDRGAEARRIHAFVGPAVHRDRYQVTDEVRQGLAAGGRTRPARARRGPARRPRPLAGGPGRGQPAATRGGRGAGRADRSSAAPPRRTGRSSATARNGPAGDSPCWPASSTEAGPRPVAP